MSGRRDRCPDCGARMTDLGWCSSCSYDVDPLTREEEATLDRELDQRLARRSSAPVIHVPDLGVIETPAGIVRTDGHVAVPQRRWRGWRDRQPTKSPVTVKRDAR